MITDGLQGFILHKRWSGDTSVNATFFTREKGIVSALSKGGRTPKKQPLLQAFTPVWLVLDSRNEWNYVRQLDVMAPSLMLSDHSLFAGLYMNEIIYHGFRQLDPCPVFYDAYVQTLEQLTQVSLRHAIEKILRRFEWQFLLACGYEFSLTQEAHSQTPILEGNQYHFVAGEGLVPANKGISGECILAMSKDNLEDPAVLKAAKWIMRRAIDHAVDGKRIRARELYGTT